METIKLVVVVVAAAAAAAAVFVCVTFIGGKF